MQILFLSSADKVRDGRTSAFLEILNKISNVILVSPSKESNFILINPNNSLKRFVFDAKRVLKSIKEDIDVLFVDNRLATLVALFYIRKLKPKCIIYDARELYLINEVRGIKSKVGCIFEKRVMNKADFVICANEERKEIMIDVFKMDSKILVFENFRKLEYTSANLEKIEKKYKYIFKDNIFTIISTAGCEIDRGTLSVIKAIRELDNLKLQLVLVGCKDDEEKAKVTAYIKENNVDNVIMLPRVDLQEVKYLIGKSNLGIAIYHKKNTNNLYCSSGKIYEYVYERIPVATSDNPPLLNFTQTYNVGFSDENIKNAIEKCYYNYSDLLRNIDVLINKQVVEKEQQKFKEKLEEKINNKMYD